MNEELLKQIDEAIENSTESLIADTIKLIKIDSTRTEPAPGAPYGPGVKKVLDTIMEMGRNIYECLDLGFGKCRFALACKKGEDFFSGYGRSSWIIV